MSWVRAVNPTFLNMLLALLHLVINPGNKSGDLHMHNKSDAPECRHTGWTCCAQTGCFPGLLDVRFPLWLACLGVLAKLLTFSFYGSVSRACPGRGGHMGGTKARPSFFSVPVLIQDMIKAWKYKQPHTCKGTLSVNLGIFLKIILQFLKSSNLFSNFFTVRFCVYQVNVLTTSRHQHPEYPLSILQNIYFCRGALIKELSVREDVPEGHGGQSISSRERLEPVVVHCDCVLFCQLGGCSKAMNFKPQMGQGLLPAL